MYMYVNVGQSIIVGTIGMSQKWFFKMFSWPGMCYALMNSLPNKQIKCLGLISIYSPKSCHCHFSKPLLSWKIKTDPSERFFLAKTFDFGNSIVQVIIQNEPRPHPPPLTEQEKIHSAYLYGFEGVLWTLWYLLACPLLSFCMLVLSAFSVIEKEECFVFINMN